MQIGGLVYVIMLVHFYNIAIKYETFKILIPVKQSNTTHGRIKSRYLNVQ